MRLTKRIKEFGKGILLAGALAVSGCSFYGPTSGREHDKNEVYAKINGRFAIDYSSEDYGITKRMQTITVHPDDGGAAKGSIDLNLNDSQEGLVPRLGLEGSFGNYWLRLKAGADASLRGSKSESNWNLQPLPIPYESYGWGEFETDEVEVNPFLGVDIIMGRAYLGFEYGFPYWGAEITHGDHRHNQKTVREKDDWHGFGRGWRVNLGYEMENSRLIWFVSYGENEYDAEFFGEDVDMETKSLTLGVSIKL